MITSGPGSQESGPDACSSDLETLRRRLYAPGGDSEEVLTDYLSAREAAPADDSSGSNAEASAAAEPVDAVGANDLAARRPRRLRIARVAATVSVMIVLLVAIGLWWSARNGLPQTVAPPAANGSTLLYYSRVSNPQSAPGKVTFEPADESQIFRADGHRLAVTLRCIGNGRVRITVAEHPFYFRCDNRLRTTSQETTSTVEGSFFIFGRTIGNAVWGLRVTSLPVGTSPRS